MRITAQNTTAPNGMMTSEDIIQNIKRELAQELTKQIMANFSQYTETESIVREDLGTHLYQSTLTVEVQATPGDFNSGGFVGGYNLEINADGRVVSIKEDDIDFIEL